VKTVLIIGFFVINSMLSAWSESVQQTPEVVNAVMSRRAELVLQKSDLERELAQAWLDASSTSDEIAAARKKYRDVQAELSRVKEDIQKAVLALPANQEKQKKLAALTNELEELNKKADAFRRAMGEPRRATQDSGSASSPVK